LAKAAALAQTREYTENTWTGRKWTGVPGLAVETIYQNVRVGSESFSTGSSTKTNIGNKVIDVALIPYIRPQTIKIRGRGMKANTRLFTFFDGEAMSTYATPLTYEEWANTYPATAAASAEGSSLVSDASGEVYLALRLPEAKRFRVGTKETILIDSPTNSEEDATTMATAYFVAHGLVQQKQDTILTTRGTSGTKNVTQTGATTTEKVIVHTAISCAGYSFIPEVPDDQEGVFLTSVDIYFAAKHPTLGVWIEVREIDAGGGVTKNAIPFSQVYVTADDLVVSTDGLTPHTFTFPAPIFVYNKTQYLLTIHTVGLNPDTYVWISRLGETDLVTGNRISSSALKGTFYTTNNNLNWDIVPDVDLKCTIRRASFTTGTTGVATIGNKSVEKLRVVDNTDRPSNHGDGFFGNDVLTLSGISGGTIEVGNRILGRTSNANVQVTSIDGSIYFMANSGFLAGESANVANANGTVSPIIATIASKENGYGEFLKFINYANTKTMEFTKSNGEFYVGDTVRGVTSGVSANVAAIENYRYSVVDFEPAYLNFNQTTINFAMRTTSNAMVAGSYATIDEGDTQYFDEEKAILSRSNEIDEISGEQSNRVQISMRSATEYLSPVLDMGRTHTIVIDNIVNNNTANELLSTGGELINKYINRPVTLAEGQDAEDLSVILTAYRPPTTDVYVWARIMHNEDTQFAFSDLPWIPLEMLDSTAYSALANRDDFREFSYQFPEAYLTGPNEEVQYTNQAGITFTGFKYFALKIGLSANNSAVVPRVADLQVIAMQK
jgi:hypothetical protein